MNNLQLIARFIEKTQETLVPALAAETHLTPQEPLLPLVNLWLETQTSLLRAKPRPLKEWAAPFSDYSARLNLSFLDALSCVDRLRKALIELCCGKIARVPDSDIIAALSDSAALFAHAYVEFFTEHLSDKPAFQPERPENTLNAVNESKEIKNKQGVLERGTPPDGADSVIEDKTEIVHELDTALRYFKECLLPLLPLATQIIDYEGNITYSSDYLDTLALDGYEKQEPLCCFLYHQRFGQQRECPCKSVFETIRLHLDEIYFDSHSDMKWFRLIIVPIPNNEGRISRAFCCVHDMTQRKQIQKQMESQILDQQRSSLVAQLSVAVAHQLRNPLSVVLGFAEMMSKGLAPEQYAEAVNRILRNSMRCKDIVESLLDFGKGMPLQRRLVDLEVLIRESVRPMLTPAQNRLVEWRFSGKPTPFECVPEQMTQALLSLLHNAFHVAQSKIVCSVKNKGELIRLRVVDDGPGIALDLRERIFEPFFTTRRKEGATGLGLSLARAVITDYGGSLTVGAPTANEPRGACMVVQLPLLKNSEPAPAKIKDTSKPATLEQHILIVDDEVDMLDLLKTSLYLKGFLSDTVATGMEALEKLKQNTYDAVVLDYKIEGVLTCAQLYQEIKEQHAHLLPRILFLTGDMLNYQTRHFIESTGRPVLEKPFLMADLIKALTNVVGTPCPSK